jgi:biopolymer transport protein ExbD
MLPRRFGAIEQPIQIISFVNILLVIFFFFLLGRAFLFQRGIHVELPRSRLGLGYPATCPIVTLLLPSTPVGGVPKSNGNGSEALIFFNEEPTSLSELPKLLNQRPAHGQDPTLMIKADRRLPYGLLAEVMNVALEHGWVVVLATEESKEAP